MTGRHHYRPRHARRQLSTLDGVLATLLLMGSPADYASCLAETRRIQGGE
jgi:hypothetical protein